MLPSSDSIPGKPAADGVRRRPESVEPRRIVYCLDSLAVGGTEMNAVRTLEALDRTRFAPSLLVLRREGPLLERCERAGIPVIEFPVKSLVGASAVRQIFRIAAWLRRERVEIVHCHDRYTDFVGVLAARLGGVKLVIASKRWMDVTPRHRLTSRIGFSFAHIVLGNSASVMRSLSNDGVSPSRQALVPNFVGEGAFEAPHATQMESWRREFGLDSDNEVVGIVASLRSVKRHATLFRAVARLSQRRPRLRLVVVGDGPLRAELEKLAESLGIRDCVGFAGLRPLFPSINALFDVAVLCSSSEGFPNAVVEAMAQGRPIVGTDVTGIRDAVVHEKTGLLVAEGDDAAMAHALDRLLSDRALADAMGAQGRARVRELYHQTAVIRMLENMYSGVTMAAPGAI